jgi:hypothetical protein
MVIPAFSKDNDTHHKRLLRGAVTEYLDEGEIVVFMKDLKDILTEEEDRFLQQSVWFRAAHDQLFGATPVVSEDTP